MDATEQCLKLWRDKICNSKRKELSPGELSSLFQTPELQSAFFKLIDHDNNGAISLEEWTGCFTKLLGDTDPQVMNWFVDKFNNFCTENETVYVKEEDFSAIVTDVEFGYRFASIICPKSRRVNCLQLISSLEIIASLSTDAKWLSWLKYQFTDAINKRSRVDSNELHVTYDDFIENFDFKEPFLAQRLFGYLDKDGSGTLSLREFINGLEVVVNGSQEEKMEFLFKVFDVDNDGVIDYDEMRMMLKCCLEDTPSLDKNETIDDLAAVLFKDTDSDDSGTISIDELKKAFKRHESLFKTLSMSTSIWIKPKFINKKKQKWHGKIKEKIVNNRAHVIFWSLYSIVHFLCALTALITYRKENIFVIFARMCGNSLNFNCALILTLVLRKHFSWYRSKGAAMFLPIDDFIEIHKIIGVVILIESLIHTVAHFINLDIVCKQNKECYLDGLFTWNVNLGFPTGIIELILLFIILFFAMSFVRNRGYFQLFYWFHSLTIPWLLIMLSHGKVFWRWLLLPGFCYAIEKFLRYKKVNSNKYGDSYITDAIVLPSKVTHLVIKRPPKFHFKPGDYIFINIPAIAIYEWHPFSISSAPENSEFIWLHIKSVGNWTRRLLNFSSSANFDGCNATINSQRSLMRHALRSRMSKVYSSESQILGFKDHDKCSNHLNVPNAYKKTVSFENKMSSFVKTSSSKLDSEVPNNSNTNVVVEQAQVQAPLRHKGILKLMSQQQGSFNGNETIAEVVNGNDIIESTPKTGDNKTVISTKNEDINLTVVEYQNKLKQEEINPNLADEYFSNKEKLMKSNLLGENKPEIVIMMDNCEKKANHNKQECVIVFNNSANEKDTSIESRKNDELYKKTENNNQDILGYLKMYQRAQRVNIDTMGPERSWRLKVLIDGPYGTPSQDIFDSDHAVLVAAGIGITPFASILQSLMQKYRRARATCPSCNYKLGDQMLYQDEKLSVKKVDFIWVTREQRSLEWFISLLSQMEIEQKKNNEMFLETHLYVTSAKRQSDLRTIGLHLTLDALYSQEESSLVDGLRQRTRYGRPNWDIVMQNLIRKQKGKINVFYCGVPALATILSEKCQEYGLVFKKEVF
ncbi:unnamed protein product [Brachionus calyciflorus]|uniref:NADPH oxidase 5 n=1 Tax=Brachionus calyciflorus TaxID=104777 RepID=A0A813ND31_9BILA|nr:unnamed protein product [Brachionus calyciflorus]